ncbi:hypothetical protein [Allokutzneria oryzae]|uniref:Alpha/beta hydrolase n=1 Tax=Allokutzneria oryzae TaxID=1378989 RepID=A0ABV5ZXJ8_9PSEU
MTTSLEGVFLGQLKHVVVELLADGRDQEARDLAWRARDRYPRQRALTALWVAETLCRVGDPDTAVAVLGEALDEGVWWWGEVLTINPPLAPIQDRADFAEIVRRSEECRDRTDVVVAPTVHEPDSEPVGVLVPLHARTDRLKSFARRWSSARDAGFRVVVPQSGQLTTSDGDVGWVDERLAREQVAGLCSEVAGDLPLVLAGYSQGARFALEWSLAGAIADVAGFVALCPPEDRMPVVTGSSDRLRGYVLTGEHDDDRPAAERFAADLARNGVSSVLDVMAATGHSYPADFAQRLPRALTFVLPGAANR